MRSFVQQNNVKGNKREQRRGAGVPNIFEPSVVTAVQLATHPSE